jgi:hypothetical protein
LDAGEVAGQARRSRAVPVAGPGEQGLARWGFKAATATDRASPPVKSRGVLGVACVVLVSLSVAGGLSIGVLAGIPFSAAATQILPYLSVCKPPFGLLP